MTEKLLSLLQSRRNELARIDAYFGNWGQITAWHAGTRPIISKYFKDELEHFEGLRKISWKKYFQPPTRSRGDVASIGEKELDENNKMAADAKQSLLAQLDAMITLTAADAAGSPLAAEQAPVVVTRRVFLVHGHEEAAKHSVARFLE